MLGNGREGARAGAPERPGADALLPVYAQFPVRPVSGRGSWLVDAHGERWLDAYGGHAVSSTGHSHPRVVTAIAEQAARLLFYSSVVPTPQREQLAGMLAERAPAPGFRLFFCNSGAEANDNALVLARKRTGRTLIASVTGGWHGRTIGTQAVTEGPKYERNAQLAGIPVSRKLPFNDVDALATMLDESIAALIVEPVQGMAGAIAATPEWLAAARARCTALGIALVFDEIQCGVGRCEAFTAAGAYGVVPDAITLAKGLASGLPIGALLAGPFLADGLALGDLGSTFGGGPVPCAAAIATLEVMDDEQLIANATAVGRHLAEGARALGVRRVEGKGLLLGLRLGRPATAVQQALFAHRVLAGTAQDPEILRLLPPLGFSHAEADLVLAALRAVLR